MFSQASWSCCGLDFLMAWFLSRLSEGLLFNWHFNWSKKLLSSVIETKWLIIRLNFIHTANFAINFSPIYFQDSVSFTTIRVRGTKSFLRRCWAVTWFETTFQFKISLAFPVLSKAFVLFTFDQRKYVNKSKFPVSISRLYEMLQTKTWHFAPSQKILQQLHFLDKV